MSRNDTSASSLGVFEQIEATLKATPHGRAFLVECERRARSAETTLLLDAVARLEKRVVPSSVEHNPTGLGAAMAQVEAALQDMKAAFGGLLAAPVAPRLRSETMDVATFGRETTDAIVAATELIQETAWLLREAGHDRAACDQLDEQTSAIHAACRRQDRMLSLLSRVERSMGRVEASVVDLRACITPAALRPSFGAEQAGVASAASGDDKTI